MTLDFNIRPMKIEDKKRCHVYPEGTELLDAITGRVAGRVIDVVQCWYSDNVQNGERWFGKTADTSNPVELWRDRGGEWFGIEFNDEE